MLIYHQFEKSMRQTGKNAIRIDVVNDDRENAVAFWEKQGFIAKDNVQLTWGKKQSTAVVMIKSFA